MLSTPTYTLMALKKDPQGPLPCREEEQLGSHLNGNTFDHLMAQRALLDPKHVQLYSKQVGHK